MAVLEEDLGTGLTLVEGDGGMRSSSSPVSERVPRDRPSVYERERARAEAAEARCEELRWAEVAARSDAGSWKSRFKACRRRLSEAVGEYLLDLFILHPLKKWSLRQSRGDSSIDSPQSFHITWQ